MADETACCCEAVRLDPGAAELVVVLDPEFAAGVGELVAAGASWLVAAVLLLFLEEPAAAATMMITTKAETQYRFFLNRPTTTPRFANGKRRAYTMAAPLLKTPARACSSLLRHFRAVGPSRPITNSRQSD